MSDHANKHSEKGTTAEYTRDLIKRIRTIAKNTNSGFMHEISDHLEDLQSQLDATKAFEDYITNNVVPKELQLAYLWATLPTSVKQRLAEKAKLLDPHTRWQEIPQGKRETLAPLVHIATLELTELEKENTNR